MINFSSLCSFFVSCYGDHRDLHVLTHSFPTRLSADLLCSERTRRRPAILSSTFFMDSPLSGNDGRRNEPLLQPPVMEPDHPVHLRRKPLIMGGDEGSRIMLPHQPQELGEHHIGGVLVEVACRLVGKHQHRPVGERAGDGDALLLAPGKLRRAVRSEEHTSELQSLMRISYAVFCLKKKKRQNKDRQ